MNRTLGSHSGEITALQNSLLNFQSQLAGMAKQILKDHTSKEQGKLSDVKGKMRKTEKPVFMCLTG